jgi:catalase
VGKKTNVAVRISTVGGEKGSADSARDPRGFSIKFYTEEGNWDLVGNHTPVFFIRDGVKFPTFIHTQKRNPRNNLKDATMFWDFLSSNQESAHQVIQLFSDRGTPRTFRNCDTFSVSSIFLCNGLPAEAHSHSQGHTFKFTKNDGTYKYVKFHVKTDQGHADMTNEEAAALTSSNPDHATEDLFNAIERGEFPSWTLYVQVMDPKDAEKFRWNILDITKVWPHSEVPLRPVGKMTLNRNPENYFAEVEQLAFSPAHLVPGIEPSADPMLQARLFSYSDTHRHRLGVNYQQIPVNRPLHVYAPFQRDGPMAVAYQNYGANPNYPSPLKPNTYLPVDQPIDAAHETWIGQAVHNLQPVTDEDFVQPNLLWEVLGRTEGQQDHLVHNISVHLFAAVKEVRERTYGMFERVNKDLGARVRSETEKVRAENGLNSKL